MSEQYEELAEWERRQREQTNYNVIRLPGISPEPEPPDPQKPRPIPTPQWGDELPGSEPRPPVEPPPAEDTGP